MRVVVTGAAGFIGSHVVEHLKLGGHEVLAVDDLSGGTLANVPEGIRFEHRSTNSPLDDLFGAFSPEVVYHLAAYAAEGLSHHIPTFNYTNNVVGTANVLAAAYRAGASHFVFTSSIAAYGHPRDSEPFDESNPCEPCDPYGAAKLACEHHIRSVNGYFGSPNWTIFRPHNVFGPRQNVSDPYRNVVGIFMARAIRGEPLPIFGDGLQTRSFSYVDTVARCIADAPFIPQARNRTFNVGGDESMTVLALAQAVADAVGVESKLEFMPARGEVKHAHCRHDLAHEVFPNAFRNATTIVEGLARMAAHVRGAAIPPPTECPAPIEIENGLPPSWAKRLAAAPAPAPESP